jgi:thioredoxin-dependent peroxiredoxin
MPSNLSVGDPAPDFDLAADGGARVRLDDFKGRTLVLYFYPKDDTSGCTTEAKAFAAASSDFAKASAAIVGVSKDSVKSHDKFKAKYDLNFALGSDADGQVMERYGVWVEKSMYGRKYMGTERTTLLIDGKGRIARIWRRVKVPGHAKEVLEAVRSI